MQTLTQDQLIKSVPSIFSDNSIKTSGRYLQIPSHKIIEAMAKNDFLPVKADQQRKLNPENRPFAKHVIRFRHSSQLDNVQGEQVPEIVLQNSHDGSGAYRMMLGIFRLVCSNGLIVASSTMADIHVRHVGNHNVIDNLIAGAYDLSKKAPGVFNQIENWKGKTLDQVQKNDYAKGAAAIYGPQNDHEIMINNLLYSYRQADKGQDLWTVFNVVQENMIKGRFYTKDAENKFRHARAIKSLDRDIKINRDLWEYTQNFNNSI